MRMDLWKMVLIIMFFIGVILILDGFISIQLQLEEDMLFQIGRIFRIIIGFILITMVYVLYMKRKR